MNKLKQQYGNYYFVALMGIATVVSGVINYLYHPLMIRFLSESEFSLFEALLSIINIAGVVASGFTLYLVQQFALHESHNGHKNTILRKSISRLGRGGLVYAALILALSPFLQSYLHLPNIIPIWLIAASFLFMGVATVYSSFLQAEQQFEFIAVFTIISALLRVGLGLAMVSWGWGLYGAIGSVLCAGLIGLGLSYWYVRTYMTSIISSVHNDFEFRMDYQQVFSMVSVAIVIMVLTQGDIVIAQHLFPTQSSTYIALSVVAKFLIFLGGTIDTVYYPQLSKQPLSSSNAVSFRNYTILMLILAGAALIGTKWLGVWILQIFKPGLGERIDMLLSVLGIVAMMFMISSWLKLFVARGLRLHTWIIMSLIVILVGILHVLGLSSVEQLLHAYRIGVGVIWMYTAGVALFCYYRGQYVQKTSINK